MTKSLGSSENKWMKNDEDENVKLSMMDEIMTLCT